MPGRKRKLSEVRQSEICALISTGCDLEQAARYASCASVTIRREMARNPEFCERVRQAQLTCHVSPLQAMRHAAKTHWRAAAWLLERTEPIQYARPALQTFKVKELTETYAKIMDVIDREIESSDVMSRIEEQVFEVMGNLLCQSVLPVACQDQFRKVSLERTQPDDLGCEDPQSEGQAAGAQNETQWPPILSEPAEKNVCINGRYPRSGSTE